MRTAAVGSTVPDSTWTLPASPTPPDKDTENQQLRRHFDDFVGQTLFGEMLKSMRKSQQKPAYFHGGRAEEVFQQQLDQVLTEKLSQASAEKITGPMYELFTMSRR